MSKSSSEIVERPWGWFRVLHGDDYSGSKVKVISVKPGCRLSLQSHNYRKEIWTTIRGSPRVVIEDKDFLLQVGSTTTIEVGQKHRLVNLTDKEIQIIEVQIGEYLGEDDIIRYQDDFNRT